MLYPSSLVQQSAKLVRRAFLSFLDLPSLPRLHMRTVSASYGRTQYVLNLISLISLLPALLSMLRMQSVHLTDDRSADAVVVMGRADQLHGGSTVL